MFKASISSKELILLSAGGRSRVAVDVHDRELRFRDRVLLDDQRSASDGSPRFRRRRELRRLTRADPHERRARRAFASCRGDAAPAAALLRHDSRGEQPGGQ